MVELTTIRSYFIRPTVIQTTSPKYRSMVEEIFGPVLTVYVYPDKDFDKVLDLCDQSCEYALTGAIFARDRRLVNQMTERLQYSSRKLLYQR